MRRRLPPVYHLLWAFPLGTAVLMIAVVLVTGGHRQPAPAGGWLPVIVAGSAFSCGQAAALVVIYRRMRRRWIAHHRIAGRHRRAFRERLRSVQAQAEQVASEDPMTGLYNQRFMRQQLAAEFERARRYGLPLSCAMLDADFFKRVNDTCGHPAGDAVIRELADCLRRQGRQSDHLGHYGGDEFLFLMPNTALEPACRLAERIRQFIAQDVCRVGGHEIVTTCSIGIACFPGGDDPADADQLLDRADRAMYEAKRRGRNRVCLWDAAGLSEYTAASQEANGTADERT